MRFFHYISTAALSAITFDKITVDAVPIASALGPILVSSQHSNLAPTMADESRATQEIMTLAKTDSEILSDSENEETMADYSLAETNSKVDISSA